MPCLLKPASRVDVRRVGVQPEVMALRVAIEVETHPVTTHLPAGREEKERAMETCCCPWMSITPPSLPPPVQQGSLWEAKSQSQASAQTGRHKPVQKGVQHGTRSVQSHHKPAQRRDVQAGVLNAMVGHLAGSSKCRLPFLHPRKLLVQAFG